MPGCRGLKRIRQSGFGLIEVSISLLLLSIGTLGLASLQISAKRLGHDALQRSEATALAMDMFERIRANRGAMRHYRIAAIGAAAGSPLAEPGSHCDRVGCTAQELNAWDLWQWEQALNGSATGDSAGGLVRPTACVAINGRLVTVQIAWQGSRGPAATAGDCGAGNYGPDDGDRHLLQMTSYIGEE